MNNTTSNGITQFTAEWEKLALKYAHLLGNDEHFHVTYHPNKKIVLKIAKDSKHKKTDEFQIVFEDGKTIPTLDNKITANHILAEFIKYVGAEKVMSLDIKATGKRNLVTTELDAISHLEPLSAGNGLYVITKTPNPEKVKQINAIIEKLNIKARVEYIGK